MSIKRSKIQAIGKKIKPTSELNPYLKALFYGKNGAGKTRLGATAPNCLIIDINEEGTESVVDSGSDVFFAKTWEDVYYAYWYLKTADHGYESVCLDNLTALQMVAMTQVLKEGAERDPNKDPKLPAQRDWFKVTEMLKPLILDFRNLPMHVIFLAQERSYVDDDSGEEEVTLNMTASNRGIATGSVMVIGRVYQRPTRTVDKKTKKEKIVWESRVLVGPHERYMTKDRTNALGKIMRNPTIPKMLELRNNKRKG